jgi:prepilin-type processing-associated H-X9-DG protein
MTGVRKVVNVLVPILIIALCAGLLLPAIARVREAQHRVACLNNLKQIGLSLKAYHDAKDCFPAATVASPDLPPEKRLSWLTQVWPAFLEGGYRTNFVETKAWDAKENCPPRWSHRVEMAGRKWEEVSGDVPVFFCPSNPARASASLPSPTHFVGMAGFGNDAAALAKDDPKAGIFGYDRQTNLKDIRDGTSTTLLVAETAWENGPWTAGGQATVRGLNPGRQSYLGRGGQFGGSHPGGVNVLFADASVRFLNESIDPHIFEALTTYAGGEQVGNLDAQ